MLLYCNNIVTPKYVVKVVNTVNIWYLQKMPTCFVPLVWREVLISSFDFSILQICEAISEV